MTEGIPCPRCAEPMEPFLRATPSGEVPLEMCVACGGVWLDGARVTTVYPGLARLPSVPDPDLTRPILACPRCADMTVGFRFFEVELDHCPGCHGVWVDGEELGALAATGARDDGRPHEPPARGYRDSAADAARAQSVCCRRCSQRLPLDVVVLTSRGPRCADCAKLDADEALDRELERYEVPKEPLLSLPQLEGLSSLIAALLGSTPGEE